MMRWQDALKDCPHVFSTNQRTCIWLSHLKARNHKGEDNKQHAWECLLAHRVLQHFAEKLEVAPQLVMYGGDLNCADSCRLWNNLKTQGYIATLRNLEVKWKSFTDL